MGRHSIAPPSGAILRSLVLGTVDLGLLHGLKRPFLAPREELDLFFLPVCISGLRPLCSLLSTVPGSARLSCRLMDLSASFLPGAEILHRRMPVPRNCVSSGVQNTEHLFAPCSFPSSSHQ